MTLTLEFIDRSQPIDHHYHPVVEELESRDDPAAIGLSPDAALFQPPTNSAPAIARDQTITDRSQGMLILDAATTPSLSPAFFTGQSFVNNNNPTIPNPASQLAIPPELLTSRLNEPSSVQSALRPFVQNGYLGGVDLETPTQSSNERSSLRILEESSSSSQQPALPLPEGTDAPPNDANP